VKEVMNEFEEVANMGDNGWYDSTVFSSESGRQAYRDDEFDWFEDICDEYGAEPELYED
jgi:hypothetical protein